MKEHAAPEIAAPEPTSAEIDRLMGELERSWTATITVRRRSPADVGYREIFVSVDGGRPEQMLRHGEEVTFEVAPGAHRIRAHNTLFERILDVTLGAGEHAGFVAINRAGWGTYSPLAFFVGFLGAGPFYLTFERERP
jgi:hypothetical protein